MNSAFRLSERLPFLARCFAPLIESILGLKKLNKLYENYSPHEDPALCLQDALKVLRLTYDIQADNDMGEVVPKSGPLIVVSNHPFGGIDGVILMDYILKFRSDVKVLANQELNVIDGINKLFIHLDILGDHKKKKNWMAFREAQKWVSGNGALILFPSGEVASWQWKRRKIMEAPWKKTVARIAQQTNASVLPVFFEGSNSVFFHSLGLIHEKVRTAWLIREFVNKCGKHFNLRVGKVLSGRELATINDKESVVNYLRLNTLLLGCKNKDNVLKKSMPDKKDVVSIIDPLSPDVLSREMDQLDKKDRILERNNFEVWCVESECIPNILREIGRLREMTFRFVGEGSGNEVDLDRFDAYYKHVFVWCKEKKEVVGAYRLGAVDEILEKYGIKGLYSQYLFGYNQSFISKVPASLEMGRSFIRPEYQRSLNILLLLWKGIYGYILRHPWYHVLFGPVSITEDYSETSRQLMASSLMVNNYDNIMAKMVNPCNPYKLNQNMPWTLEHLTSVKKVELLSSLVRLIEGDKGIPILVKQYLKLKGVFAGFNIDPDFGGALDGLIIVDLLRLDEKALSKYASSIQETKDYFSYHRSRVIHSD